MPPPLPTSKDATDTAPKGDRVGDAYKWVVEGDYKLIEGSVTSGGQSREGIHTGEKLVAYLHLFGLALGDTIHAELRLVGPEGTVFEEKRKLMNAKEVRKKSGVVAVACGTLSSWAAGDYTFHITLKQKGKSGRFFIPITLKGQRPDPQKFTLLRFETPERPLAGRTMEVWALLSGMTQKKRRG